MKTYVEYKLTPAYKTISDLLNSFLEENLEFNVVKCNNKWCLLLIKESNEPSFDKIANKLINLGNDENEIF